MLVQKIYESNWNVYRILTTAYVLHKLNKAQVTVMIVILYHESSNLITLAFLVFDPHTRRRSIGQQYFAAATVPEGVILAPLHSHLLVRCPREAPIESTKFV